MLGITQLKTLLSRHSTRIDYVTLDDFIKTLGVKPRSAKRYITALKTLGVLEETGKPHTYKINHDNLKIIDYIIRILNGEKLSFTELLAVITAIAGKYGEVNIQSIEKREDSPRKIELLLRELEVDEETRNKIKKFITRIKAEIYDPKILLVVLPRHRLTEAYMLLQNSLRGEIKMFDIEEKVKILVIKEKR